MQPEIQPQMIRKNEEPRRSQSLRVVKNEPVVAPPKPTKQDSRTSILPWILVAASVIVFAKYQPLSPPPDDMVQQIQAALTKSSRSTEINRFKILHAEMPQGDSRTVEYRAEINERGDVDSRTELRAEAIFNKENGRWVLKSQRPLEQRTQFMDGQAVEVQ